MKRAKPRQSTRRKPFKNNINCWTINNSASQRIHYSYYWSIFSSWETSQFIQTQTKLFFDDANSRLNPSFQETDYKGIHANEITESCRMHPFGFFDKKSDIFFQVKQIPVINRFSENNNISLFFKSLFFFHLIFL